MLNEFVIQYDKALTLRRSAEEDQDFRTQNSKPTLHSDHPLEAFAAECYTRNIYDIFKKEWMMSFDCGHEKISKDSSFVKYRVGCLNGNKENWKLVEYKLNSDFVASCSCTKFETYGILCKQILFIMRRKSLTIIPNHYILPRWTMKATYKVESIGGARGSSNSDAAKEFNNLMLWSLRAKFNKVLEDGHDSLSEIEKLNTFLDVLLEEQNKKKKARVDLNIGTSSTIPSPTQEDMSQHISVFDPLVSVKTKGRPKIASRIKSGIEKAMDSKKRRTCSYCGGKGHNTTGCQKRKADKSCA